MQCFSLEIRFSQDFEWSHGSWWVGGLLSGLGACGGQICHHHQNGKVETFLIEGQSLKGGWEDDLIANDKDRKTREYLNMLMTNLLMPRPQVTLSQHGYDLLAYALAIF